MLDIGTTLRKLRQRNNMTAIEVSQILKEDFGKDITPKRIYNYEKNVSFADSDVFLILCMIYKCDDVLYEFGCKDRQESYFYSPEERQMIKNYRLLPAPAKNVIKNSLGVTAETTEIKKDTVS